MLLDTKDKPYICHCGTAFARRDLLTRHERLSHGHNSSYNRIQTSAEYQASTNDNIVQSPAHARNVVDVSVSDWTAPNSEKGTGSQWFQQDQSSEAINQNLSKDVLGTLSQPGRSAHDGTVMNQQYEQLMSRNNRDTFLSPGTNLFSVR